jgi:hypothetical protein
MNSMKRTRLNQYSLKRIVSLNAETPIRIALCERAGGIPVSRQVKVYHNGDKYSVTKVVCVGGKCECGQARCKIYANNANGQLEPHENPPRSKGTKVSLEHSIMVLRACHRRLQGREPQLEWIR